MERPTTDQLQAILDCINEAESSYGERETFDAPDPEESQTIRARKHTISSAREGFNRIMAAR